MFNRPLNSFVPHYYNGVVEMDEIIRAEESIVDIARVEMATAVANTFVLTANESGVIMFEKMLNIIANASVETLEFRRERIINRMAMSPPFTFRFLKNRLDETIGVDAWKSYIDFPNYTLYVESLATDQNWFYEIEFMINRIKPCNIVFTNVPYTARKLKLSEEISYATLLWNYRMGSWKLGNKPFSTMNEGGILKMPNVKSIQPALLNNTANFVLEGVHKVVLNDNIEVTEFSIKEVVDNVVTVQYYVLPETTTLITDMKILNTEGEVLSHAAVYVPISQPTLCKHTITVKEGA